MVEGKIDFNSSSNGQLYVNSNYYAKIGNDNNTKVWYKDQNNATSPIRITKINNYNSSTRVHLQANATTLGNVSETNNPVIESGLIDFSTAFQTMRNSSTNVSQNSHNAQLTNPNGQSISNTNLPNQVKINLQNGINYLNITGSDLNNVDVFTYNNQPSSSKILVINVDASGTFNWDVWNQAGVSLQNAPFIIYNFHNTTKLKIKGNSTIEGTVFAPYADIEKIVNQSNIQGQVIGKSLVHSGGEMHCAPFTSDLNSCENASNTTSTASILDSETKTLTGTPQNGSWSIISGGGSINGNTYTPTNISINTDVIIRYTVDNSPCTTSHDDVTFSVTIQENICTIGAIEGVVTINDPDADGINNICDLDDDNDGILDTNEGCDNAVSTFPNATKGYLFQGKPTTNVYLVDLISGESTLHKELSYWINGVAVNEADGKFWAVNRNQNKISIIDPITLNIDETLNIPASSVSGAFDPIKKQYVFTNSSTVKVIDGDPDSPTYKTEVDSFNGPDANIIDIGYNANDGNFYGLPGNSNTLYKFDISNKQASIVGDVDNLPVGSYGAIYATIDGKFYLSNNGTGVIYLLELNNGLTASYFSNGPASGTNDGAKVLNVDLTGNQICLDTDNDGIPNSQDIDSDGDGCFDVVESGGIDSDNDGYLDGTGFDNDGKVIGGTNGYNGTEGDEIFAHQVVIENSPEDIVSYSNETVTFSIDVRSDVASNYNGGNPSYSNNGNASNKLEYKWYEGDPSSGGQELVNNAIFSGVNSSSLQISNTTGLHGNEYFVKITHLDNACVEKIESAKLIANECDPIANNKLDTDNDGIADDCDLDDDNDGILDINELCSDSAPTFPNADKGYLFQGTVSTVYSVDLNTGESTLHKNLSFQANAVAVNESDGLFWAVNRTTDKIVLIDPNTFDIVETLPISTSAYSGAYNPIKKEYVITTSEIVQIIDADPASPTYKTITNSFSGEGFNVSDIGYNASDGKFYGVANDTSKLYKFDTENSTSSLVGSISNLPPGIYGAVYSTLDGNIYLGNNASGVIYYINLANGLSASFFSNGPTSGYNDGAKVLNIDLSGGQICLDTDNDGIPNSKDLDSDGDGCFDVVESGGVDVNNDGILDGNGIDTEGKIIGSSNGYNGVSGNENNAHQLRIISNLNDISKIEGQTASLTISASAEVATNYNNGTPEFGEEGNSNNNINYKWYLGNPDNGGALLSDLGIYSSTNTASLQISDVTGLNNNEYYVVLTHSNNSCLKETSSAILIVSPLVCTKINPTTPASDFNIFTLEALALDANETQGSVATGGDLTLLGNYQVATSTSGSYQVGSNNIGLLVGGKINYQTGNTLQVNQSAYAQIGQANSSVVWYADPQNAPTPLRITSNSNYDANSFIQLQENAAFYNTNVTNNPVFNSNLIDFDLAFQSLRTNAMGLSQGLNNALLKNTNGQEIQNTDLPNQVYITLQEGINYLNLKASDLNNVAILSFTNKPSETKILVVNIDSQGIFDWHVWDQSGISEQDAPYVIYNFYNTTELQIEGTSPINGSILAPYATIAKSINQSNIVGQVIGISFTHSAGTIQSANFNSLIDICVPPNNASPIAEFTVNNNECLTGNTFAFSNTSNTGAVLQPNAPITYTWDFGDGTSSTFMSPTKTYATAGNYTVTLLATNSFGSDTKTSQVTILPETSAVIAVSQNSQANGSITKSFTLSNTNDFTSYSWTLPGQGSDLYPNQDEINITFTEADIYTISLLGVNTNGCSTETNISVTITSEEVSGGNGGGVESESLGDAISKIYVARKKNSVPTNFVKSDENLFNKKKMKAAQPYKGKGQTLLDMFPTELVAGNIANITSPTDILDYTVADEVLSVDFSIDGKTKGVVLGIKTSDKIYNHTKASCDRLRGAEILNIETVQLEGYNFLMQGIKQRNGLVEYAISFATAKNNNDNKYTIQTNWYVNNYTKFNDVYNFQVWSTNPRDTKKLVVDVLKNLNSFMPITQTETQKIPQTYAAKIARDKNELVILMRSTKAGLNTEIAMEELYSETANNLKHRYNPINTQLQQTLRIDIKDGYEYDALIKVNGEIEDAFYHADGNWGLDYDKKYTEVKHYFVSNDFDRAYNDDEYPINRNVEIKATSEYDYLTVYKSLLPGTLSADYSQYNYLAFTAKGSGLIELGLLKSSIQDWKAQYKVMVDLSEEEQTYYVPFDIFSSSATQEKLTAEDLTTLIFTFLPVEAQTNELDLEITDVKFTKVAIEEQTVDKIETFENEFMAYPNPSQGNVNLLLFSETDTEATITLSDITGKVIYKQKTQLNAGKNELDFEFKVKTGVMLLNVNSNQTNYGTSKIIFK